MNKSFLLIIFCILNHLNSIAQNAVLKGRIIEKENNLPMIQAKVIIDISKGLATTTNMEGYYELKLQPGTYTVTYGYVGKMQQVETFKINADEVKTINITLSDKIYDALKQVVVSGSRYEKKASEETVTIEVLKSDVLLQNNITDVEDGMNKVPGVTVTEGQANIRGGSGWSYGAGSRVMVLLDDIPLLTSDANDAKWSFMPIENVDQIEVIKGAASSIYGTGALNGVINVRTGYAKAKPETKIGMWTGWTQTPSNENEAWWKNNPQLNDTNPFLIFNRNQPYRYGFNGVHKRKIGNVDLVIGGQFQQEKTSLQFEGSSEWRITNKLRWKPKGIDGLSLGVNTTFFRGSGYNYFMWKGSDSVDQAKNGGDIYARIPLEGTASSYNSQRFCIDPFINFSDKKGNNFSYKGRFFNATNKNTSNQGSVPNMYYSEIQYNRYFEKSKINLVTGLVYNFGTARKPTGDTVSLLGEHNSNNLAVYFQIEKKLLKDKINLTFGGRYEYVSIYSLTYGIGLNSLQNTVYDTTTGFGESFINSSGKRPLFRIGMNYNVAKATYLRLSAGEGYRFPSMVELFVNTTIGPLSIFPNKKLKPEYGCYAEIGVKQGFKIGENWIGYGDVAGYVNLYQNMMEFNFGSFGTDPNPFKNIGFSSQNVGNTLIAGIDFSAGISGKIGNNPIQVMFGYTYIIPKSLNWTKNLALYDGNGNLIDTSNAGNFLGSKNNKADYASTSTSTENILKYRNRHTFTFDGQYSPNKWDIGLSVQIRSWMDNIDYAFVSDIFKLIGGSPFKAIDTYRKNHDGQATILIDTRLGRRFGKNDCFSMFFVMKNLLNQTYEIRPALLGSPRNYSLQFTYKF